MIDPVSRALQGLLNAESKVAEAADKIATGDISADSMVALARESTNVKAQVKNVKAMLDTESSVLDILA
ncbi:MAG: hypothetical protein KDD62_10210 [Bdellovibrionales bacterium]|nr:hypothetical protein [Bdellovibrionales bacterium]